VVASKERAMKPHERVKPISYLKARGEAKAVLQDLAPYEEQQQTLALLKILTLSQQDFEQGRVRPSNEVFEELRRRP
jgi:hypothetical protein